MGSDEMVQWWRAWTNVATAAAPFRAFGQDSTGGLAAFWCRTPDEPLDHQPVVFLGSEGEYTVIARDLGDYLWLLANGVGPLEAVDGIDRIPEPTTALTEIARRYTGIAQRSTADVIDAARAELSGLEAFLEVSWPARSGGCPWSVANRIHAYRRATDPFRNPWWVNRSRALASRCYVSG
jgi:hypothetical protein